MRIFSGIKDRKDVWAVRYRIGEGMKKALKKMGHDLIEYNWGNKNQTLGTAEWQKNEKQASNKKLIEEIKKANEKKKIDLFISDLDSKIISSETIEEIKKLDIITLNFATDAHIPYPLFLDLYKDIALAHDYNWTCQPGAFEYYKNIGANFIFAAVGADPDVFKPYDCKRIHDITFVGRKLPDRYNIIKKLIDNDLDVKAWGPGWKLDQTSKGKVKRFGKTFLDFLKTKNYNYFFSDLSDFMWQIKNNKKIYQIFGPEISDEKMVKLYSESKVSLNFSSCPPMYSKGKRIVVKTIKGRDVEAPMSGAFYMTEHIEDLKKYYKIGEEIETYNNSNDLVEKIKYYLENPEEADSIRRAGREKALNNYTWEKSFEKVFNEIGLK